MIEFITNMLSSSILYNIAVTILHSLWQGAVLVLLMNVYLKYNKDDSPTFRYNIAFGTLMLIGISALGTFTYYNINVDWNNDLILDSSEAARNTLMSEISNLGSSLSTGSFSISQMIPLIAGLWILGVVFFSLRLLHDYSRLVMMKKSLNWNTPQWLSTKVEELREELHISKEVGVALSQKVIAPFMMGVLKPIIVFPVAAVNQLSPQEIELILRHELGHVIRQDYVQNFILRTMEVIMFYHPCVWWTIKIIEKERENHCDDYAVAQGQNRLFYAKTLVKIREMNIAEKHHLALGFATDNKSLLNRIKRILNHNQKMSIMKGNLIVGLVLLSSLICLSAGTYYFKNIKTNYPEKIEGKMIKSLDITTPSIPLKLAMLQRDTSKEETRKMIREKRDQLKAKSRELKESMRELREELRTLEGDDDDRSYNIHIDGDWDDEDWDEFSEKMERMGEKIAEKFEDGRFEEKMEKFGRKMEKMGDRISQKFDDEEFQMKVERLANSGAEVGLGVAASVLEAFGHEMSDEFEYAYSDLGESIGDMVVGVVDGVMEGFDDFDHDYYYVNADKNEFSNLLLDELKADGYYNKKKVSLTMDHNGMKINGKTPSREIREKYYDLISEYHDIDKNSGHKLSFKYSEKKGKKSNSISIEKSN